MSSLLSSFDIKVLHTFQGTFDAYKEQGVLSSTVTFEVLKAGFTDEQRVIFDQIIQLNPSDYGVNTPYEGELEPVPDNLVTVSGQSYNEYGVQKTFGEQFVPRPIFSSYTQMNNAFMAENPDRKLLIASAYRSPAYQVVVFINWCISKYDGDIASTIRHASPPNYSQHTFASRAAMDFATIDGSPHSDNLNDFKDTVEYAWLRQHANAFYFYESWLEGNEFGMRAEPWHWQFRGNQPDSSE